MGTPADVIKTRIMNNPTAYRGVIDCFITAVNMNSFFERNSSCHNSSKVADPYLTTSGEDNGSKSLLF